MTPPPGDSGRPFYKRGWFFALLVVVVLAVVGAMVVLLAGGGDDDSDSSDDTELTEDTDASEDTDAPEDTEAPDDTEAPEDTDAPAPTDGATTTAAPEPTSAPTGGDGSREAPFALLSSGGVGSDYTVAVTAFDPDATDIIRDENASFDEPPDGFAYVLITLQATYNGASTGSAYIDLTVGLAGDDGAEYPDTDCSALVPNDMFEQPDLNPGETAEGAYCAIAPIADIPSMDIFVRPTGISDDDTVWWLTS